MKDNFDAMKSSKGKTGKFEPKKKGLKTKGAPENFAEQKGGGRRKPKPQGAGNAAGKPEKPFGAKEFSKKPGVGSLKTAKGKNAVQPKMPKKNIDGSMRLNRYISNAGVCSRREADEYIAAGLVTVNGEVVTELGVKVSQDDVVKFDGRALNPEKKVYLLLNKPKNYVTTTDDPHAQKIVMDLVKNACNERIYPVGRLDRNTTGVLLFTNDGDLSKRLTHPSYNHKKIYQVHLDKPVLKQHMLDIAEGIELEDGVISSDEIKYISMDDKSVVGIEIHSGRNRIVRRIFEHLGYHVKSLDRVYFAGLTKKNLPRGKWRMLDKKEVAILKMTQ